MYSHKLLPKHVIIPHIRHPVLAKVLRNIALDQKQIDYVFAESGIVGRVTKLQ